MLARNHAFTVFEKAMTFFFKYTTVVAPQDSTLQGHIARYWANAISFIACSCTRQALALDNSSMVDAALQLKSLPTPGLMKSLFVCVQSVEKRALLIKITLCFCILKHVSCVKCLTYHTINEFSQEDFNWIANFQL